MLWLADMIGEEDAEHLLTGISPKALETYISVICFATCYIFGYVYFSVVHARYTQGGYKGDAVKIAVLWLAEMIGEEEAEHLLTSINPKAPETYTSVIYFATCYIFGYMYFSWVD